MKIKIKCALNLILLTGSFCFAKLNTAANSPTNSNKNNNSAVLKFDFYNPHLPTIIFKFDGKALYCIPSECAKSQHLFELGYLILSNIGMTVNVVDLVEWNLETGLSAFYKINVSVAESGNLQQLAIRSDGKKIIFVIAPYSHTSKLIVYDIASGEYSCRTDLGFITGAYFDTKSDQIITLRRSIFWKDSLLDVAKMDATLDEKIDFWSADLKEGLRIINNIPGNILIKESNYFIVAARDVLISGLIRLYDSNIQNYASDWISVGTDVHKVVANPNGTTIAVCYGCGKAKLFDVKTKKCIHRFYRKKDKYKIYDVAFSPDGRQIAVCMCCKKIISSTVKIEVYTNL